MTPATRKDRAFLHISEKNADKLTCFEYIACSNDIHVSYFLRIVYCLESSRQMNDEANILFGDDLM